SDTLGTLPLLSRLFGGPASGASFMTAGLILAVMITPIITSLAREVLLTVAQDDKNAALAMGATRWEMLRVAVFPRVRSGLVGAVMLGLGRAMGETIAVALVIGSSPQITSHLFRPGDSMASVIAHNFPEATGVPRAALIGMGVVLFAITIVVYVASKGAGVISGSFLTKDLPIITQLPGGGIKPAIVGTAVITGVAALMAIPLGVLAAVYLNEYGRNKPVANIIRFMADVMT